MPLHLLARSPEGRATHLLVYIHTSTNENNVRACVCLLRCVCSGTGFVFMYDRLEARRCVARGQTKLPSRPRLRHCR